MMNITLYTDRRARKLRSKKKRIRVKWHKKYWVKVGQVRKMSATLVDTRGDHWWENYWAD